MKDYNEKMNGRGEGGYDERQMLADTEFVRRKLEAVNDDIRLPEHLTAARLFARMEVEKAQPKGRKAGNATWLWRMSGVAAAAAVVILSVVTLYRVGRPGPQGQLLADAESAGMSSQDETMTLMTPASDMLLFASDYSEIETVLDQMVVTSSSSESKSETADDISEVALYYETSSSSEPAPSSVPQSTAGTSQGTIGTSRDGTAAPSQAGAGASGLLVEPPPPTQLATPDLICADNHYLYTYKGGDKAGITIVKLPELTIAGRLAVKQEAGVKLYIDGDNLVLIEEAKRPKLTVDGATAAAGTVCVVTNYDVSDRAAPAVARSFCQDGRFAAAQMVDGQVFVVSVKDVDSAALAEENSDFVKVPVVSDSLAEGPRALAVEEIGIVPHPTAPSYAVVSVVPVNRDNGNIETRAVLGGDFGKQVLVGEKGVYVWYADESDAATTATGIVRFGTPGGKLESCCFGRVEGKVPVSGGLLEMDENLVVLADVRAQGNVTNALYVLGNKLQTLGDIKNLSPGSSIDRIWTRRQYLYYTTAAAPNTLHIVDLSQPSRPEMASPVAWPGRFDSLCAVDHLYMFGIGENVTPTGKIEGVRKSVIDFSDPLHPREVSALKSGFEGSYTPLRNDSRGLMVDQANRLVGVPMVNAGVAQYGDGPEAAYRDGWRYIVYRVAENGELISLGQLIHSESPETANSVNSRQNVVRCISVGGVIYAVSASKITAHDQETLEQIGEIMLV